MSKSNTVNVELLDRHFEAASKVFPTLAEELDVRSHGVDSSMRKQLATASDFLRGKVTPQTVARRPDVLAFVLPLVQQIDAGHEAAVAVAGSVHRGVGLLSRHGAGERRLGRVLLFPFVLTLVSVAALVSFSHWILPQFEKIYLEFGINLPLFTEWVFGFGRIVRWSTLGILGIGSAILPAYLLLNAIGKARNPGGPGMVDRWLTGKRLAMSRWLFHASLLLEAGAQKEAFPMSANCSGSRWLIGKAKKIASSKPAFAGRKFAMAQAGINMRDSPGQIAILRQIATWYRDRSGNFLDWWVSLYVSIWGWLLIAFFFFAMAAMLSPIFSMLRGLIGGVVAGVL